VWLLSNGPTVDKARSLCTAIEASLSKLGLLRALGRMLNPGRVVRQEPTDVTYVVDIASSSSAVTSIVKRLLGPVQHHPNRVHAD
jgi:hypothetical protein